MDYLSLDPYKIMHGQIWRLFTWLITPPQDLSIFIIIMFLFYYSIGTALERYWGKFFYNLYIFSGFLFTIIGSFIAYFVTLYTDAKYLVSTNEQIGMLIGSMFSTYYVLATIFFAYTALSPNEVVLLYAILPIKIKWLAYADAALIVFDFIRVGRYVGGLAYRICIIMSLLNFIIYFLATRKMYRISPSHVKQKAKFKHSVKQGHAAGQPIHKCTVCGRTELDDENLTFRYCSKCNGSHEYCQDHLFTHEHIR